MSVETNDGLAAFDGHLKDFAYASGYTPSGDDMQLFASLSSEPTMKYVNVLRWYRNISSFSDEERKLWPAPMTSVNGVLEKLDEDIDLFGSDGEDDDEKARITAARLKAYEEKKAKKPAVIAKSNIIFDVKPWDDSVEIADIEKSIRTIELDGLVWGAAKVLPVAYGIKKLQICCVVEDEKVSSDWLEEQIMGFDDLVQSVDIIAFNKMGQITIHDYLYLIQMGCTPLSLPKVRRLPFDPLKHQTIHLERLMRSKGLIDPQLDEKYRLSHSENIPCDSVVNETTLFNEHSYSVSPTLAPPPPSPTTDVVETEIDYRIHYSYRMLYLLKKVAEILEEMGKKASNPSILLSINQLSIVETAFEFIIPTAVRPYVDDGVILHLGRSSLVEHWKPIVDDVEFRKEQLRKALEVFNLLMNSCEMIKNCVVRKFLADYICLNEQLIKLGEKYHKQKYGKFILTIDRPMLITSLFILLTANKEQPKWLHKAISKHITKLLLLENGLYHLITAITEGANCFGDFGFVQSLSRILVTVPYKIPKEKYYISLIENFLVVIEDHPNAGDAAVCFAVVLDMLPKELVEMIFDTLLLPWENLKIDCFSKYPSRKTDFLDPMLDRSLRILSFYAKALPRGMHLPLFRRFKALFNLWTLLYASYTENENRIHGISVEYDNAGQGIFDILHRILDDPSFETVDEKAEFLVRQIEDDRDSYLPELSYRKVLIEEVEQKEQEENKQINTSSITSTIYGSHIFWLKLLKAHYANLRIHLVKPGKAEDAFIRFEKGILKILQKIQGEEPKASRRLAIRTAMCCIERWAEVDSKNGSYDSICSSEETSDNEEIGFEGRKQKVNYFLNDLLPILSETGTLSDENLANLIDIPLSILDVATVKLNVRVNTIPMDIRGIPSEEDKELEATDRNNIHLALTILQCILVFKQGEFVKFMENLVRGANILQSFSNTVSKLNDIDKKLYLEFQQLAGEIIALLKANNIEPREDDAAPSFIDESPSVGDNPINGRGSDSFSLEQIQSGLLDESESVRGHALINLARGIRRKNRQLLDDITTYPAIMRLVLEQVADNDSYVYLAAINALAELAYWKQQFFDEMVEFFLDPAEKLKSILEFSMDNLREEEKETYLLIQRVKIGEAIAKANKNLGEMAPAYFDRMVNPMLSLMLHTKDDMLRASVLSSLSNLIVSCRGLNIHKHLDEMLLAAKLYIRDAEAEIVRRAAVDLMRAIVRTYDISLLQEAPSHLYDIADSLSYILDQDEDLVVKTHAMLCLQDIDAQMEEGFLEFEKAHTRKIRF
uniref:RNA polymerase II assembly factor Rtp1 C-terminal domain-containing protein n=1 Tax=Wuchereria bancrofti TaxID=6293 RepID=A0AAF5PNY3_WUCBA